MPRVLCAVKAVILHQGKFLLLEQMVEGEAHCDLPGGRMEFGETPEQALHREISEETSLIVEIEKLLGCWWFFRKTDGDQVMCLTFVCRLAAGDVRVNPDASETIGGFAWITKEEFLHTKGSACEPSLRDLIAAL